MNDERCNCPNPSCKELRLTMKQIEIGVWQCDECEIIQKWAWTR